METRSRGVAARGGGGAHTRTRSPTLEVAFGPSQALQGQASQPPEASWEERIPGWVGWGGAYHKGEAFGRQGPELGGTVPHAHLHQGVMGPHSAGISDLADDPVGHQGPQRAAATSWVSGPPHPLQAALTARH